MSMMAVVFAFYTVWLVLAAVVVGPLIVIFSPVLLLPALVLPIFATHYLPMLMARAVEGLEFALGIRMSGGGSGAVQVGDVVEAAKNPGSSGLPSRSQGVHWTQYAVEGTLARITCIHSGCLYRLFRGDRYDVEITDESAVKFWKEYLEQGMNSREPSEKEMKEWQDFKKSRDEVLRRLFDPNPTLSMCVTPTLTLTLPCQTSTGKEKEVESKNVALSQGFELKGVKFTGDLYEQNKAKNIKRVSASASSSSATKLQLEDKEKQQIGEATLEFKASVTVVLCVAAMALPLVQFYQRDQDWSEYAHDLILETFGWEQLSLQFLRNLSWPTFNVPAISASFFLSMFVLFLTLVRVYATQLLLWCSGQSWFAMADSKPDTWEQRGLVTFASVRYVE